MASSLSQHEAAAKALESDLLSSHTRTDYELIEQEGKKLVSDFVTWRLTTACANLDTLHSNRFAGKAYVKHWLT